VNWLEGNGLRSAPRAARWLAQRHYSSSRLLHPRPRPHGVRSSVAMVGRGLCRLIGRAVYGRSSAGLLLKKAEIRYARTLECRLSRRPRIIDRNGLMLWRRGIRVPSLWADTKTSTRTKANAPALHHSRLHAHGKSSTPSSTHNQNWCGCAASRRAVANGRARAA